MDLRSNGDKIALILNYQKLNYAKYVQEHVCINSTIRYLNLFKLLIFYAQAGIPMTQLTIALEPEAASIYCQSVSHNVLLSGTNNDLSFPGKRYLVADIGGNSDDVNILVMFNLVSSLIF